MNQENFFTEEQLVRMGTSRMQRAIAAINSGDKKTAVKEVRGLCNEFLSMHNILRDWIAAIYSYIYIHYGDEDLYQLNRDAVSFWFKDLMKLYLKEEPRRRAEMLVAGLRGHLEPLKVEEDEEKFTITMLPCGSGGKLMIEGAYRAPRNLARVKMAQAQTFGKENFPIYCTHCAILEIVAIEELGYPIFITDPRTSDSVEEVRCQMHIYKDPKDIPEKFYERLGKRKPD